MVKPRESGIELLRIFTMFGVIILHYNNPSIGGALSLTYGVNKYILYFWKAFVYVQLMSL